MKEILEEYCKASLLQNQEAILYVLGYLGLALDSGGLTVFLGASSQAMWFNIFPDN
jgi:hypothetical protein